MLDLETSALLRAVLDELCESVSRHETGLGAHVSSRILEAAMNGERSLDDRKSAAPDKTPSMWR